MILQKCSKCGAILESPGSLIGQEDYCPLCKQRFIVQPPKKSRLKLGGIIAAGVVFSVILLAAAFFMGKASNGNAPKYTTTQKSADPLDIAKDTPIPAEVAVLPTKAVKPHVIEKEVLPPKANTERNIVNTPMSTQTTAFSNNSIAKKNFTVPDLGLEMVWVGPGSFDMGNENGEPQEKPVHRVTIGKGFWIGKYEITQEVYEKIIGNNPSEFKGIRKPVETVSWYEAVEFCSKLTQRERNAGRLPEGYEYKLPSEAQWEYAARGGNKNKGYKYRGNDDIDSAAWYEKNSGQTTHDVGQKKANELGIYDMSGNVWEWCEDTNNHNYNGAPIDGSAWLSGGARSGRVVRGGCWLLSWAANCSWNSPAAHDSCFGFRVVLALNTNSEDAQYSGNVQKGIRTPNGKRQITEKDAIQSVLIQVGAIGSRITTELILAPNQWPKMLRRVDTNGCPADFMDVFNKFVDEYTNCMKLCSMAMCRNLPLSEQNELPQRIEKAKERVIISTGKLYAKAEEYGITTEGVTTPENPE